MVLLCFFALGIGAALAADIVGWMHVAPWGVPRRCKSVAAWRRSQAYGIAYVLVVAGIASVLMIKMGFRELFAWSCQTPWVFALGCDGFVVALFLTRMLLFWLLVKHWHEAEKIIEARKSKPQVGPPEKGAVDI